MASIYEYIQISNNRRPVYTSYELSKMVREKRKVSEMGVSEFAAKYDTSEIELLKIEEGTCSFTPRMYKACSKILDLTVDKLIAEYEDDLTAVSYRATDSDDAVQETVKIANMLFNEMIMQEKIGTN